jgi:hypothetical protein
MFIKLKAQGGATIGHGEWRWILGYGEDDPYTTVRGRKTEFREWLVQENKPISLSSTGHDRVLIDPTKRKKPAGTFEPSE